MVYNSIERGTLSQKCQFSPLFGHVKNESDSLRYEERAQMYCALFPPNPSSFSSSTFSCEFSPPQCLSSLLSIFYSLHRLTIKLLIATSSGVVFLQLFYWLFPLFHLAFLGSDHSCTGRSPLHRGFSTSCMWPAWVSFPCAPSAPKALLVPLRQLARLLHFLDSAVFPCIFAHA